MIKNLELKDTQSTSSVSKKNNRCRSFHFRYMELCRSKNLAPLSEIRAKNSNSTTVLEFYGDKLNVTDWLLIMEALYYDQVLQCLSIHMRKSINTVLDNLDTEKKAKLFKQKPVICTKFIFSGIVEAIANCIQFNKNLKVLSLEGLPLNGKYIDAIAKALSHNESIKEISFSRSSIYDKGCEAICNTIKYLDHVEKLCLSECELTAVGAEHVADMIKIQKITRYTEGWQKSLRYRDFDPDSIRGLRSISLARNPLITDDGLKPIAEVLKEDCWVKTIDMENCGLTDRAANLILDCLDVNRCIIDFNVRDNNGISKFLMRSLRDHLGKEDEEKNLNGNANGAKGGKLTMAQLREKLKALEEQLEFERELRKKAELLNEKLNMQIIAYENSLDSEGNPIIPDGYVVVKNDSLMSIINERNDLQMQASSSQPTAPSTLQNPEIKSPPPSPCSVIELNGLDNLQSEDENEDELAIQIPTPSPSVMVTSMLKERRNNLKLRKVKSEMKYIEPPPKSASTKKKESKSDHELSTDNDYDLSTLRIETNIGDSTAVNGANYMPPLTARVDKKTTRYNNIDMDDLSISSARSTTSDGGSSDSDTLRNTTDYQPMKVFVHKNSRNPPESAKTLVNVPCQSPRSIFLGIYKNQESSKE